MTWSRSVVLNDEASPVATPVNSQEDFICKVESLSKRPVLLVNYRVSAPKKILFPDHNFPGDSQISVSIVPPGREHG